MSISELHKLEVIKNEPALNICKIGNLITSNDDDNKRLQWHLFTSWLGGKLKGELSADIDFSRLHDFENEPNFVFCDSFRYFIQSSPQVYVYIEKGYFYAWLESSIYFDILKDHAFVKIWCTDFIQKTAPATINNEPADDFNAHNSLVVHSQENLFMRNGDHCIINFNGNQSIVKVNKGLQYIEYLLRNKERSVHVFELYNAINPTDTSLVNKKLSAMSIDELNGEGLSIADLGNSEDILDSKALSEIKKAIIDIDEQISEAKIVNDLESVANLKQKKDDILSALKGDFGYGNNARKTNSELEKKRKSIQKRISEEKKHLASICPEFAEHLIFINTGVECQYTPSPNIEWSF